MKGFLNPHCLLICPFRNREIGSVLQKRVELQSKQPAFRKNCAILFHIGLKVALQLLIHQNNGFPEHRTALGSSNIKHIRKLCQIL